MAIKISGVNVIDNSRNVDAGIGTYSGDVVIADKIVHSGDTDTAIRFPAADTVAVETAGSEALRVDSSGRLLVGTSTAAGNYTLQLEANNGSDPYEGSIFLRRGLSNTALNSADYWLGTIAGGSQTNVGGRIRFETDAAWGTNDHPTRITFSTTADSASSLTERMRIDSSGNVGVGTISPGTFGALLEVNGMGIFTADGGGDLLRFKNSNSTANLTGYLADVNQDNIQLFAYDSSYSLSFGTNNTERARIDSSGRLLVGTNTAVTTIQRISSSDTPAFQYQGEHLSIRRTDDQPYFSLVKGNTVVNNAGTGRINFQGYDGSNHLSTASIYSAVDGAPGTDDMPGRLVFATTSDSGTSPTERMTIKSSGQTLVGTTESRGTATPAMLQIAGGNGSTTFSKVAIISGNNEDAGGLILASSSTNSLNLDIDPDNLRGSSEFKVNIDATARMRIQQSGQTRFFANADSHGFKSSQTAGTDTTLFVATGGTGLDGGTLVMTVRSDGDLENVNNSYGAISDVKLKENIVDAASQWDDLKALQVRRYNFKEETGFNTHTQLGLIAQEVELVSPGLVSEVPDRDEEGNDLGTTTKSVNYSVLYMKAVGALQEAIERIETLETQNAAILARLDALEAG